MSGTSTDGVEVKAGTVWFATMNLRIVRDREWISDDRIRIVDTLQQLWKSEGGDEDWRNVEIVEP